MNAWWSGAKNLLMVLAMSVVGAMLSAQAPVAMQPPFDVPLYVGVIPGAPLSAQAEQMDPPAGNPLALVTHVQRPEMRVFLPDAARATGAAVVIYPGGGYHVLAIESEGWAIARWLNTIGVAAIVVKYRVSRGENSVYPFPVPLLDARQAVRVARRNAHAWRIDPTRVGVMGFSAGGHLASMMLTMAGDTLTGDSSTTAVSHRPDFGVLVYPVITLHERWAHHGSRDKLLGPTASDSARRRYSTETRVTSATPPTFLIATQDDDAVPMQNASEFFGSMTLHKVAGELHVWEKGGHGFGMLTGGPPVTQEWPLAVERWLRGRGVLQR
jgi:acetyl esterase/lipase